MRQWKIIAAVLVVGLTVSAVAYAQGKGVKALTAQDKSDIEELYTRYNWGIDTHAEDGMAWAKTFTPDGEFIIGTNKTVGRDQLAAFAKLKPGASADGPHHFATNIHFEASPEGARGSMYFLFVSAAAQGKPAAIVSMGTYQDVLVKTSDGWRFKSRTFYPNALSPSPFPTSTN